MDYSLANAESHCLTISMWQRKGKMRETQVSRGERSCCRASKRVHVWLQNTMAHSSLLNVTFSVNQSSETLSEGTLEGEGRLIRSDGLTGIEDIFPWFRKPEGEGVGRSFFRVQFQPLFQRWEVHFNWRLTCPGEMKCQKMKHEREKQVKNRLTHNAKCCTSVQRRWEVLHPIAYVLARLSDSLLFHRSVREWANLWEVKWMMCHRPWVFSIE